MANPMKIVKAITAAKKKAQRAETNKIQKNSVKVKPAAKQKPNRPNVTKAMYKSRESSRRAYITASREYEKEFGGRHGNLYEMQYISQDAASRAKSTRKTIIAEKKLGKAQKRKATTPKNESTADPFTNRIKIKSSIPKRRGR